MQTLRERPLSALSAALRKRRGLSFAALLILFATTSPATAGIIAEEGETIAAVEDVSATGDADAGTTIAAGQPAVQTGNDAAASGTPTPGTAPGIIAQGGISAQSQG